MAHIYIGAVPRDYAPDFLRYASKAKPDKVLAPLDDDGLKPETAPVPGQPATKVLLDEAFRHRCPPNFIFTSLSNGPPNSAATTSRSRLPSYSKRNGDILLNKNKTQTGRILHCHRS